MKVTVYTSALEPITEVALSDRQVDSMRHTGYLAVIIEPPSSVMDVPPGDANALPSAEPFRVVHLAARDVYDRYGYKSLGLFADDAQVTMLRESGWPNQ